MFTTCSLLALFKHCKGGVKNMTCPFKSIAVMKLFFKGFKLMLIRFLIKRVENKAP